MHRIDKYIFEQLLTQDNRRFSELKPFGVESNTFSYRLKRLIKMGLVAKAQSGLYELTSAGRLYTDRLNLRYFVPRELPKPISLLLLHEGDDWYMYKRKIHPLRGLIGLPHANVHSGIPIIEDAEKRLATMGLVTKLAYRGGCYLAFYKRGKLESYNQANILENIAPIKGRLKDFANTHMGEYVRVIKPDFSDKKYVPSLQDISQAVKAGQFPFFMELVYGLADQQSGHKRKN